MAFSKFAPSVELTGHGGTVVTKRMWGFVGVDGGNDADGVL